MNTAHRHQLDPQLDLMVEREVRASAQTAWAAWDPARACHRGWLTRWSRSSLVVLQARRGRIGHRSALRTLTVAIVART